MPFIFLVAVFTMATVQFTGMAACPGLFPEKLSRYAFPAGEEEATARPVHDVTARVEFLGNPFADNYPDGDALYARNVWDLQRFAGRIFIGAGNSSNIGPAPNAGPLEIKIYDPDTEQFSVEGTVEEEQIDIWRILDHRLHIPGHDPTQNWKFGNFYRRDDEGTWTKYRNIPGGLHAYDMAWLNGGLYVGLGTAGGGQIMRSVDDGRSWSVVYEGNRRIYSFLQVNGSLFGVSSFETGVSPVGGSGRQVIRALARKLYRLWKGDDTLPDAGKLKEIIAGSRQSGVHGTAEVTGKGEAIPRSDIGIPELFPDTKLAPKKYAKVIRPLAVGGKAVYMGAYIHNDHQSMPFGLYLAASLRPGEIRTRRIALPENLVPWDFLVEKEMLYVLAESIEEGGTVIHVLKTSIADPARAEEIFRFSYPSFARSFETMDGDFYFGIGCEVKHPKNYRQNEIAPQTGNILKVGRQWIQSVHAGRAQ